MNQKYEDLLYQSGLTASGCWDELGTYEQEAIERFAELIVGECMRMCDVAAIGYESHGHMKEANGCYSAKEYIEQHFGVEE